MTIFSIFSLGLFHFIALLKFLQPYFAMLFSAFLRVRSYQQIFKSDENQLVLVILDKCIHFIRRQSQSFTLYYPQIYLEHQSYTRLP